MSTNRPLESRIAFELCRAFPRAQVIRRAGLIRMEGPLPPAALRLRAWVIAAAQSDHAVMAHERLEHTPDTLPVVLWRDHRAVYATATVRVLGALLGLRGRVVDDHVTTVEWLPLLAALSSWRAEA